MQQLADELQQLEARGRGLDAAIAHLREWRAERVRELSQHAGDRGLREGELLGRARDGAQAHAGFEGHHLRQEPVAEIASQS